MGLCGVVVYLVMYACLVLYVFDLVSYYKRLAEKNVSEMTNFCVGWDKKP